jgi:tRNA modification GTPase
MQNNTIFALSSAPGKSGVSVFRVSGPESLKALNILTGADSEKITPQKAKLTKLYDNLEDKNQLIDEALVLYFRAPNSFTGEDVVEFHTHGSIAVKNKLTEIVLSIDGIRLAEPGEFSKRGFLNGKMDLTSAEGLSDLIEAETSMQLSQATSQMSGEFERFVNSLREKLLKSRSLVEAFIDFPEEDIPEDMSREINSIVEEIKTTINEALNDNRRGERLREGLKLAIAGKPNVGKSSLMNFLTKREVAIVSSVAGTTRDVLESHLDIGGYPIILQDTAGIRKTGDIIEQEGVRRAKSIMEDSDIKIIIVEARNITEEDRELVSFADDNTIILVNKLDQFDRETFNQFAEMEAGSYGKAHNSEDIRRYYRVLDNRIKSVLPGWLGEYKLLYSSISRETGTKRILEQLEALAEKIARPAETTGITRARHRQAMQEALENLEEFSLDKDIELAGEDLRLAARSLAGLTGIIDVEEILGEIFSNFCIGK